MASAAQDQWEEITAAVRAHLVKKTELLPAMTPAETQSFVSTLAEALNLELNAGSFDDIALERIAEAKRNAAFGG